MVTLVGTQSNFLNSVKELIELDFDAIEAYDAAINRLKAETYRLKLTEFKEDHERHVKDLTELLRRHGEEAPTGPSLTKQWLTKGKVVLANLISDEAVLKAMLTNEVDTNTAYERMNDRQDKWPDAEEILQHGLSDERRHKKWLEETITPDSELEDDEEDTDLDDEE